MSSLELIVTQGPYSAFLDEVVAREGVSGVRLNTVMAIREAGLKGKLRELHERVSPKALWLDLKARQLRVREFANTPYTAVTISHRIEVNLPTLVYFDNGNVTGRLVDIDGHRLILEDYVGRLLGPGESVNIIDPSLRVLEPVFLTDRDRRYVELAGEVGIGHFMLSFVEGAGDVEGLREMVPGGVIMAKVESRRGLGRVEEISRAADLVLAARGDLYTELDYPHEIGPALRRIREVAGDRACVASRMLESLLRRPMPSCADIMDIQLLREMGYGRLVVGDDICFRREVLLRALSILRAVYGS